MENTVITKMRKVKTNGEFVLINYDKGLTHHGSLEDFEDIIYDYLTDGGSVEELYISEFNALKGVDIRFDKKFDVSMDDNEADEESEEFHIYDQYGIGIDSFLYEDDAIARIKELLEEEDYTADQLNLKRKVEYTCTYSAEKEKVVSIEIPDQEVEVELQTGGTDWDSKPSAILMQELQKIQEILSKRIRVGNELAFGSKPVPDPDDTDNNLF